MSCGGRVIRSSRDNTWGPDRRRPPGPPRRATARSAYSLIELVSVVLILGILVAVAAPRLAESISYHRLQAAADRIQADLKLARKEAITTCSDRTVSFDVASDRYILAGTTSLDHPGATYEVDLSEHPYSVTLVSAEFAGAGDTDIQFNGYGMPDSGGSVVIQTGGQQRTISVSPDTGLVSIQ